MVEHIGLEVMTKTRLSLSFSEFNQAACLVPCVHYHFFSCFPVYAKKLRRKISRFCFFLVLPSINARKSDSPFLSREFCRKREKTRGHLSCFIPIRTGLKIPVLEYISNPFMAVFMQNSACSTRTFEVKAAFKHAKSEKRRLALYLRYMVVLGESARILRLSSIL